MVRRQRRPHRRHRRRRGRRRAAGREAARRAVPGGRSTTASGSAARRCRRCSATAPGHLPEVRLRAGLVLRRGRGPRLRPGRRPHRSGVRTRRATPADFDAVREVYDAWAAAQNGPLTRRGPSFPTDAEGVHRRVHRRHARGGRGGRRGRLRQLGARPGVRRLVHPRGLRPARPERGRLPRAVAACWGRSAAWSARCGCARRGRRRPAVAPVRALERGGAVAVHAARPRRARRVRGPRLAGGRRGVVHRGGRPRRDRPTGAGSLVIEQGKATCTPTAAADAPVLTPGGPGPGVGRRPDLRQPAHGRAPQAAARCRTTRPSTGYWCRGRSTSATTSEPVPHLEKGKVVH